MAVGLPLLLASAGCAGNVGADVDTTTTASTAPPDEADPRPCAEDRHLVVFDFVGLLTVENIEVFGPWITGEGEPTPRPGSLELVQAYRDRGYEILYLHTIPPDIFPDRSVVEVLDEWLRGHGYPVDERARIWDWDGVTSPEGQTWVAVTDELLRLAGDGVSVDAAYSENPDRSYAFATGGVPVERNFTISPLLAPSDGAPTSAPTTPIPNDDLRAHLATVEPLPPVCAVG